MKNNRRIYSLSVVVGGAWLALFLFYAKCLPYHLFHREQMQLFLWDRESIVAYFCQPAALARLMGNGLTQFFYYEGMGPFILATLLMVWGIVVYRLFSPYIRLWALGVAGIAVLWEAGRQCGLSYPLWGTCSLIGIGVTLEMVRYLWRCTSYVRWTALVSIFILHGWLWGGGYWKAPVWNWPHTALERMLGVDCETYFGRRDRLKRLFEVDIPVSVPVRYYKNLWLAQQHQLPQQLLREDQPASFGLFLPVVPTSNYFNIFAANEVWFALGDMTMAEHAAILGMIFSPQHTGTRAIRRLAEINLILGDDAAALKYLRLLRKTFCHREWALNRWPGRQTPEVKSWLKQKRSLLPQRDTLRSTAHVPLSLRLLLEANPDNIWARDYLLCFDLLHKDIASFVQDYQKYGPDGWTSRLYAEAMLIYLAGKQASLPEVEQWKLPAELLQEFGEYTRLYQEHQGDGHALQSKYGQTYWFYFHYATFKYGKDEK